MVVIHNPLEVKIIGPFQESSQKMRHQNRQLLTSWASSFVVECVGFSLYCTPHSGASHSSVSVPSASRATACQAADDDAEEGDDAVNDRGEHVADAADNGHDDGADGPEDGFELLECLVSI